VPSFAAAKIDPKLAARPAGLTPASIAMADVLRAHEKVLGTLDKGVADTRRETWTLDESGFVGTETLERSGRDYFARIEHPPFVEEYGQRGDKRWHRRMNGTVSPTTDFDDESFVMLRVLEDAADPKNDISLIGESAAPAPAYVIEVKRPGDDYPEWVWYDKTTSLVTRIERVVDDQRVVSTYDDYRTVKGVTEPWHVHDAFQKDYYFDYRRSAMDVGVPVATADFDPPASNFDPAAYAGRTDLPARTPYGTIAVRLMVQGRGLDFELGAGARQSYIDRDVASELKLPTFGQLLKTSDGKQLGYDTVIPEATIGNMTLKNFKLRALDFNYVNGRVYWFDEQTAKVPTPADGAIVMPVTFDDGLALVSGEIGGHATTKILIDNQFSYSFILGSFSRLHPDAVPDIDKKQHGKGNVPFADSNNNGREAEFWLSKVSTFKVAQTPFLGMTMLVTDAPLLGDRVDAVVGTEVLSFFDVYLDYPNARVVLMPNAWFSKVFRKVTQPK
jgi:hypothetical protein